MSLEQHEGKQKEITPQYVINQLATNSDITHKIARYGERTPVAPQLTALTEQLEMAVHMPTGELSNQQLTELYIDWEASLKEARDYFDD